MSDLIDREEALKAVSWDSEAYYAINNVPSAEKTGKWTDRGSLSCRCSECGCKSPKEYRYCPNCGARMVEE